ncbi:MAG: transglycosylase SLT domain-containing protein [Alphaproteobacteria bacterium]|jgi:soluble lytic murein transglycosylase-like protein|nr:transglycosylase SLT domain-containing protein [Alphaproteobacteria bacterium]
MKKFTIFILKTAMFFMLIASVSYADNETKYFFERSLYYDTYKELPKVLSEDDVVKYYNAYNLQKKGKFSDSDEVLATVENPILVGYIYYIRYFQTNYTPTFDELKGWLDKYSDIAVASLVYKKASELASNRSQTMLLKKPNSFYERFIPIYKRHDFFNGVEPLLPDNPTDKITISTNKTTDTLKRYIREGKTLNAKRILLSPSTIKNLDSDTYDDFAATLAKSYFLDGDDTQAVFWARKAIQRKPEVFTEASFTMGLAYYRLKEYSKAADSFKRLMKPNKLTDDAVSKGAYWYSRVSLILGNTTEYYNALRMSSKYIYNFYGILASEELGVTPNYTWTFLNFPKESISVLNNNTYAQRALALLQFGLLDWAEQELIFLANYDTNNMSKEDETKTLNALIYMAQQIPMPALGLKFAGQQGMYYGLSHLAYPIFFVELKAGYELDPALLLAIMRRESNFYTGATSVVGATGLMQLMPRTADYVVKKYDLDDELSSLLASPKANIEIGQQYVKQLLLVTNGNLIYVLGGFNGGSYNVDKWRSDSYRHADDDPLFFIESIPYKETRNYVKTVTADYWIYQYKLSLDHYALYSLVRGGQPIYYNIDQEAISKLKNFSYKPN